MVGFRDSFGRRADSAVPVVGIDLTRMAGVEEASLCLGHSAVGMHLLKKGS